MTDSLFLPILLNLASRLPRLTARLPTLPTRHTGVGLLDVVCYRTLACRWVDTGIGAGVLPDLLNWLVSFSPCSLLYSRTAALLPRNTTHYPLHLRQ